jgi:type VI secretion system protein ImpH
MADQARDPAARLSERLRASPWAFELFQALRLVECTFAELPRLGTAERAALEPVRLGQRAETAFPPAEIAGWQPAEAGLSPRLAIRSFGLFGPQGPLPLHLTVHAEMRRDQEYDPTFQDFADVLHHRLIMLHYRAWATRMPVVDYDRPGDSRFVGYVGALAGLPERPADPWLQTIGLRYAGYFADQQRHAEGLRQMIEATFAVGVAIIGFIGERLAVPASLQARLDGASRLGRIGILGARVFERQGRFRLRLGPLDLADLRRLLPGEPDARRLRNLVRMAIGDALAFEVQLVLRAAEVPAAVLGRGITLGQVAWLPRPADGTDADELVFAAERLDAGGPVS